MQIHLSSLALWKLFWQLYRGGEALYERWHESLPVFWLLHPNLDTAPRSVPVNPWSWGLNVRYSLVN